MLGGVTATKVQREALLDEFERSGLKGKPFARMAGVNYQTFASWIQKRGRARSDYAPGVGNKLLERRAIKPVQSLRLLEAVVARPNGTSAPEVPPSHQVLEVLLPGGAKLLIASAPQVALAALAAQLIAALRKLTDKLKEYTRSGVLLVFTNKRRRLISHRPGCSRRRGGVQQAAKDPVSNDP